MTDVPSIDPRTGAAVEIVATETTTPQVEERCRAALAASTAYCNPRGSADRSGDRVQQVGKHVRPFQCDEVAGLRDLVELGVGKQSPVGLPV